MPENPKKRGPTGKSPKGSQEKKSRTSGTSGSQLRGTTVRKWLRLTGDFEDKRLADLAKNVEEIRTLNLKKIEIYYHTPETKKAEKMTKVGHYDMYSIKFVIPLGKQTDRFSEVAIYHGKTMKEAVLGCRGGLENAYGKEVTDIMLSNIQQSQQKGMRRSVTPKPQDAHPDDHEWETIDADFYGDKQVLDLAKKVANTPALKDIKISYDVIPAQPVTLPGYGIEYHQTDTYSVKFEKKGEKKIVAMGQSRHIRDAALDCRPGLEKKYGKEIVDGLFSHMQRIDSADFDI